MNCAEFQEQVDAWALGALDAGESAACAAHLAEARAHDGCLEALARARETAAALSATLPGEKPPPRVWPLIERALDGAGAAPVPLRRRERLAWTLAVAAASAALVMAWALRDERRLARERATAAEAARLAHEDDLRKSQDRAARADADRVACLREVAALHGNAQLQREAVALLEDPSTRVVPLNPAGGGTDRASAIFNANAARAIVISSALDAKPGSDYELWVIRGHEPPKPAGFLESGAAGVAVGEIDRTLLAEGPPDAFAVSLEPAGGRPTPTQVILVGPLKS